VSTYPAISPDHPEFDKLQDLREPPPKSPQVERLESYTGFYDRAQRLLFCNKMGRYLKCKKGHLTKQVFSCGLRFCPVCSIHLADEYFKRTLPVARAIQRRCIAARSKVVLLAFSAPCERNQDAMEDLIVSINKRLSDADITCPYHLHFAGFRYEDGNDRAIVLILLEGTEWHDWKKMFAGDEWGLECCHSYAQSHLVLTLHAMMKPLRYLSPIERADHEVLFERFHMRRAYNIPELSVEELEPTDISLHKGCPNCGEPWVEVSEPFPLYQCKHMPDPKNFRWNAKSPPST
jgi:hypothetical protein